MEINGTYGDMNGKFSKVYGNVGVVDCHYFLKPFFDQVGENIKKIRFKKPKEYLLYHTLLEAFREFTEFTGYTMCDMGF